MGKMWKRICVIAAVLLAVLLIGCGAKKIVHCDGCGKEIQVPAGSDTDESWVILCSDCQEKVK